MSDSARITRAAVMQWTLMVAGAIAGLQCGGSEKLHGPKSPPAMSVQGAAGEWTSSEEQRKILNRLARTLAVSLARPPVRKVVYDAIKRSPYREQKLHLRTFLTGEGRPVLEAMAAAWGSGTTTDQLLATLGTAIDLEFYMPVRAHKKQWSGGSKLIVATALRDHEVPVAYDLEGNRFTIESADTPPTIPALVLVPVETDFSSPAPKEFAGNTVQSTCPPTPPSVCMTFSYIPGKYEGWGMGDPEFETFVFVRSPTSDIAFRYRCAGAQGTSYYYDQNISMWYGQVELVSGGSAQVWAEDGSKIVMFVWEDDAYACTIKKDSDWLMTLWNGISVALGFAGVGTVVTEPENCDVTTDDENWTCWVLIANFYVSGFDIFNAINSDDFVGELVPTPVAGPCYNGNHMLIGSDQGQKGCVQINGLGIVPPPPPPSPPLVASIGGPSEITVKGSYTWTVNRSGGPGSPYTYRWDVTYLNSGQTYVLGTAQSQSAMVYSGDGPFDLSVRVTSAGSETIYAILHVEECISSCAGGGQPIP
jgi:hypothetical protein